MALSGTVIGWKNEPTQSSIELVVIARESIGLLLEPVSYGD